MFSDNGESDIITPYKVIRMIKIIHILTFPIWIIIGLVYRIYRLIKPEKVSTSENFLFNRKESNKDLNNG